MNLKEIKTISKTIVVDNSAGEDRRNIITASVRIENGHAVEISAGSVSNPESGAMEASFTEHGGCLSPNIYAREDRMAVMADIDAFINAIHDTYDYAED